MSKERIFWLQMLRVDIQNCVSYIGEGHFFQKWFKIRWKSVEKPLENHLKICKKSENTLKIQWTMKIEEIWRIKGPREAARKPPVSTLNFAFGPSQVGLKTGNPHLRRILPIPRRPRYDKKVNRRSKGALRAKKRVYKQALSEPLRRRKSVFFGLKCFVSI